MFVKKLELVGLRLRPKALQIRWRASIWCLVEDWWKIKYAVCLCSTGVFVNKLNIAKMQSIRSWRFGHNWTTKEQQQHKDVVNSNDPKKENWNLKSTGTPGTPPKATISLHSNYITWWFIFISFVLIFILNACSSFSQDSTCPRVWLRKSA